MPDLMPLKRALIQASRPIDFWWRDDDAGRSHPRLLDILRTSTEVEAPVALAVVPAWLERAVIDAIGTAPTAAVIQHGWSHENHAASGERKIELGGLADRGRLLTSLREGRCRLADAFGGQFSPIMVPPWNRIAPDVDDQLPSLGFEGLSAWPDVARRPTGLARVDTHVDPFVWKPTRVYGGLDRMVARLVDLVARGEIGPIGLLSHHLVFDDRVAADWRSLLDLLRNHANSRFLGVEELFREAACRP